MSLGNLADTLRPLLIDLMPETLYEGEHNWGKTTMVRQLRFKGRGLRSHLETVRVAKNDGTWRKVRLTTQELPLTLEFRLSDLVFPNPETMTFKAFLAFQAGVQFEQQIWESGLRLYSGSTRARLRLKLNMDCENVVRLDPRDPLPDLVFRLRLARADLSYDKLVVEHVAGIGGSGAKLLGMAIHDALNQWRPSIERNLLNRAQAAIVKAADTKEVRLSLGKLWKK